MKRLNTLFHIIKVTGFNQFLTSFVSFIFISGGILLLVEPQISNYWDGLWYAFVTSTTVGYGDILAFNCIWTYFFWMLISRNCQLLQQIKYT